jgi:hypothetical protein
MNRIAAFLVLCLLGLIGLCPAQCLKGKKQIHPPLSYWQTYDYQHKQIDEKELASVNSIQLEYIRGYIFGRHGRIFKEEHIQSNLDGLKWYKRNPKFSNSMLNDMERRNLDLVRGEEAKSHSELQPGDLRFWVDKPLDPKHVDEGLLNLHIMKAEIEAIHGKMFDSEPQLQAYFEDRYWYKPNPAYNERVLNPTEKANLKLLSDMERKSRGGGVSPGEMLAYTNVPFPADALKKSSLMDLRLMRNEFFAIHGRPFKTEWLNRTFRSYDWYKPGKETPLNPVENENVIKIVKRENEIHQSLGTTALSDEALDGMYLEDLLKLKNEIYARHGRVFKTKWLQNYFSSLSWYKPNPEYSEKLLSNVERKNLQLIASVAKGAQSQFDMAEG